MARKGNPILVRVSLNRLLLLIPLFVLLYLLCLSTGGISFFYSVLSKVASFIGVKALSFLFSKMGCSPALAFVIGCTFQTLVTALPTENLMFPEGTSAASNSPLTLEQAVLYEKDAIRSTLLNGISRYLEIFDKEIVQEYPGAAVRVGTLTFIEELRKSLVSDYGFENPAPSSLTDLKRFHDIIKRDLSFLDEETPYYRNNMVYDNIRAVIMKEKG